VLCVGDAPYFSPIREGLHNINPLDVSRPGLAVWCHRPQFRTCSQDLVPTDHLSAELHACADKGRSLLDLSVRRQKGCCVVYSMAQLRSGEPPRAKGFIVHSTVSYANLVPSSQLRGYRVVPNVHTEQEGIQPANCLKAEYADDVCCLWSSCPKISAPLRPLVWEHANPLDSK